MSSQRTLFTLLIAYSDIAIGYRFTKVWRAIRVPVQLLHPRMAVGIVQWIAFNLLVRTAVVNQKIYCSIR